MTMLDTKAEMLSLLKINCVAFLSDPANLEQHQLWTAMASHRVLVVLNSLDLMMGLKSEVNKIQDDQNPMLSIYGKD